jgi:hypothetical protein
MSIGAPRDPRDYAFWLACHELECDLVYVLTVEHCKMLGLDLHARRIDSIVRWAMQRYYASCSPPAVITSADALLDLADLQRYRELGRLSTLHAAHWPHVVDWLDDFIHEEIRERLVSEYGFERHDDAAA